MARVTMLQQRFSEFVTIFRLQKNINKIILFFIIKTLVYFYTPTPKLALLYRVKNHFFFL